MKICITARGPSLESAFEPHFARAPYFILYNTRTGKSEAIRNGFVLSDVRIGQNTVHLLRMNEVGAVITGETGDNARDLLKGTEILLHLYKGAGMVKDAIDAVYKNPPGSGILLPHTDTHDVFTDSAAIERFNRVLLRDAGGPDNSGGH